MQHAGTVMVVDDDPLNLELLEAMLEPEGYNVVLIDSGDKCLQAVPQKKPDIILLDALMPKVDGFQVTKRLKTDEATRKIPVVMVTSLSDLMDRVKALEAGADDFLSKPLMKIEVLARVRSLINVKRYDDLIMESEKRFRNLVQDANVIIVSMNDQGKIGFMNEYGLAFFECITEELSENLEDADNEPKKMLYWEYLQKTISEVKSKAGTHSRSTIEHTTRSGRRVWVDWTIRSVVDEKTGKMGSLCVGIDVTVTKRAQMDELRRYERRKVRDILNDAISQRISQTELLGMLQQMGLGLTLPYVLTLLSIPDYAGGIEQNGNDLMEWQFQIDYLVDSIRFSGLGIASQSRDGIVVLQSWANNRNQPISAKTAKLAVNELIKTVGRCWPGKEIKIGMTHSSDEIQNISELYEQAHGALKFGEIFNSGQMVYHWSELGCFQFVIKDFRSSLARQFVQEHLGPIINDSHNGNIAEELTSLEAIISGDSLQVIADRLHVHRQTMVFRKRKIEEKLGEDLDKLVPRTDLAVALKLYSLQYSSL